MLNALISSNLLPRGRVITTLKQLVTYRKIFWFFFFQTFHFVNKALTYCIRTLLLWSVYLMLSSRWHATERRCCVATSFTEAAKPRGTSPVSRVMQCCYKWLLCDVILAWYATIRFLDYRFLVQRWVAQGLLGLKQEGAQKVSYGQASAARSWKCKAKPCVSHHSLPKPMGVPALLLNLQLCLRLKNNFGKTWELKQPLWPRITSGSSVQAFAVTAVWHWCVINTGGTDNSNLGNPKLGRHTAVQERSLGCTATTDKNSHCSQTFTSDHSPSCSVET